MRFLSILRRLKYLTPHAYHNPLDNSYLPFYLSHFEHNLVPRVFLWKRFQPRSQGAVRR